MNKNVLALLLLLLLSFSFQKSRILTKKEIQKIKKGLFIDSYMLSQNALFYNKTNSSSSQKEKDSFRNLDNEEEGPNSITLKEVGFFSYTFYYVARAMYSYELIFSNIYKDRSKFILYPYGFKYKDPEGEEKSQTKGGFFSLNPSLLPTYGSSRHYFENLKDITSVDIEKSKALYDIDIGILTMETIIDDMPQNLFSEADLYCNFFVQRLGKVSLCVTTSKELSDFRAAEDTQDKGAVMLISPDELNKGVLFNSGLNNFGLLIIPDHVYDTEATIKRLLTTRGINYIKQFIKNGGNILVSGKSGYLLNYLGIISDSGLYNTEHLLFSENPEKSTSIDKSLVSLIGCQEIQEKTPTEQPDYFKQAICMNNRNSIYLTSSYRMNKENVENNNWDVIMSIDSSYHNYIKYKNEAGDEVEVTNDYFPMVITKQNSEEGRIIIINGNLFVNTDNTFQLIMDTVFYSMGKNVIFDAYIKYSDGANENLPIPGGEEGVRLNCYFRFLNLFESPINNIVVDLFIAQKTSFITIPEGCTKITNDKKKYSKIADMDLTYYAQCTLTSLQKYSEFAKEITIEILDQSVTQKATAVPIFHTYLTYKDSESGEVITIDNGAVEVTASLAAVLRVTANVSPGGHYPLRGRGMFFDFVFNVENKENTEAKNVNLITVVPLITPVLGGSDQTGVIHSVEFYHEYYKNHDYKYPWTTTGADVDYLDYAELSGKDVLFSTDWDHPVKQFKVQRSDLKDDPSVKNLYEVNGNLELDVEESKLLKSNNQILLKEMYFKDADLFYEVASQRHLAFIDTSTEKGAKAYYNNNIPEENQDPDNPNRAKINLIFSRIDLYFKINNNYQIPENIKSNVAFTVDKYETVGDIPKAQRPLGKASADKYVDTPFDSTQNGGKLIPNEFYNVLKQHSDTLTELIDPLDKTINITEKFPDIKLSHYLILINGDRVNRAGSMEGFIEDEGAKTGYLKQYPDVKFIFAHTVSFIIGKKLTRLGGKLIINLGTAKFKNNQKPSENEFVTLSVDGIAIYKIDYDYEEGVKNIITAYFKRGLMPDETSGKDSTIQLNIEELDSTTDIDINIDLYELKYDLSQKETNFETYPQVTSFKTQYILSYKKFFSLPCLIIENKFKRKSSTRIKEYELINPYARYSTYYQELIAHRTVWGTSESHHFSNPGLQAPNGGFSLIGSIGTSSIPFADYVSHGGLMIPSAISTSRIEWYDVWGRHWVQPVRSLFPDVPPKPSPYQDFMMSTTFEIMGEGGRNLEWYSDESAKIRVHIKFFNNYLKYFNLAVCQDNQHVSGSESENYFNIGHSNVYGTCYNNTNSFLSGRKINQTVIEKMEYAMLCADSGNSEEMVKCTEELKKLDLPLLVKKNKEDVVEEEGNKWNYSPLVNNYYPSGYIDEESMWEMTKKDYASNVYSKGYPWHFDNNLPGLEGNEKPENLMAFPIFKGFGYKIEYSPTTSVYHKYNNHQGWWCDNLQNKDNTLLAGQSKVNVDYSIIGNALLSDNDWINAKNINNNKIKDRLKNRYVCEFNQHRIKITSDQKRIVTPQNIYQNNIIPIYPDMDENDYTNFDCSNVYQYTPENISLVDNRIRSNTDRDWLYFALNLRGEAKESMNILLTLTPFSDRKFEGETKVQDGGRFSYHNPALGPNAYIYIDNNVNIITSKRVDLTCNVIVYPSSINTFKTVNYHLFTIEDPKEELREYTSSTYNNAYGFGDSTVSIYVGGTEDSDFKISPGETTYIKYTFYNNAGFDWNMKGGAIEKEGLNIAQDDLMKDHSIHAIQVPTKYNFLELDIPDEIKDYIEIVPSDHNKGVEAQFFDFQSINVVTIKDGFQGEYFYKLTLKEGLDAQYFGRIWEIKVKLIQEYFDSLPGYNDKASNYKIPYSYYHDYTLSIPPILFGIPYPSSHQYAGKVFYTLGRASDMKIIYNIYQELTLDDIKIVDDEEIEKLQNASASVENVNEELLKIWDNIKSKDSLKNNKISATVGEPSKGYKKATIDVNKVFPNLPYEVYGQPDVTKYNILVKLVADQFTYGSRQILNSGYVSYNDGKKTRSGSVPSPHSRYVVAYGPWIKMTIDNTFLEYDNNNDNYTEQINQDEVKDKGYMKMKITAKNAGSKDAYQTRFQFVFSKYATLIENYGYLLTKKEICTITKDNDSGDSILNLNLVTTIEQNTKLAFTIYLKYDFLENESLISTNAVDNNNRILQETTNKRVILKSADVTLCQDQVCGNDDSLVNQVINLDFKIEKTVEEEIVEEKKEDVKEEKEDKSLGWIAGLVAGIVVIGVGLFLFMDYKKHILFFKNNNNGILINENMTNKVENKVDVYNNIRGDNKITSMEV